MKPPSVIASDLTDTDNAVERISKLSGPRQNNKIVVGDLIEGIVEPLIDWIKL